MLQMLEIYSSLALYNGWMNQKFLSQCSQISDETRKKPSGTPFGSIHGVWNHILLADRLWLARFEGKNVPALKLSDELYADWEEFKIERAQTDTHICDFVALQTIESLSQIFEWTSIAVPKHHALTFGLVLTHFFNHQTHHRGQISALMEQNGLDCGVTDFPYTPGLPLHILD